MHQRSREVETIRLAELMAALSLATDLGLKHAAKKLQRAGYLLTISPIVAQAAALPA